MTASRPRNAMMQGVQNPELIYRSAPLPAAMRERLIALDYAPQATELLMSGLPIVYSDGGLMVEYPDGHRQKVRRTDVYSDQGEFERYRYEVVEYLSPAPR